MDKAMETSTGKQWVEDWTKSLNKTSNSDDCPQMVIDMWHAFSNANVGSASIVVATSTFDTQYLCMTMDGWTWDISSILSNSSVRAWQGDGKTHLYIWFLFKGK